MKIIYDGHVFRWQTVGGVSRYFREVISRLPLIWQPTILGEEHPSKTPNHPHIAASGLCSLRPRRLSQPAKTFWWKAAHISRAAVFHPTYYNLTGGLRYTDIKCPIVITVHDLIAATYPALEDGAQVTLHDMEEAVRAAAHAICVSKATERDLLSHYPQLSGKTSVIYHGSSFSISAGPQTDEIFLAPRFLYVGRRGTYKNFSLLLRAFANACTCDPNIHLTIAGAPLSEEERWQIHFLGITDRIESEVYPSEEVLSRLYRRSLALLYPSRHEGFGIPPLEAMACGTLAVTSNTTSLPEVVGDAGIMLDPANQDDWTECILAIAHQKVPRKELLARGHTRASQLTWDESARQHISLYKKLIGVGP